MTKKPTCGSDEAKQAGCTCPPAHTKNDGQQSQFIPLSCPVHSPFYKKPEE